MTEYLRCDVQDVIVKMGSKHHIISGGDRNSLLDSSLVSEVLAPVVRIVKTWRAKQADTEL